MAKVSSPSSKMDDKMAKGGDATGIDGKDKDESADLNSKDDMLTPTHSKTDSEHKVPESPSPKGQAAKKPLMPITRLSPSQLRDLMKSKRVAVLFVGEQDSEPRVLIENLPVDVASTFSTVWRDELAAIQQQRKVSSGSAHAPVKTSLTIHGGSFSTYKMMVNWMLSCCRGNGIRQWPVVSVGRFTNAYLIRMCSNHIGCDYLVEVATEYMQHLANTQIHSEDCRALWLMTPPDPEMKQFLVQHVASRFWLKTIRGKASYWTLREEIPDLDKAVREALGVLATAHKEQKKMENAAKKEQGGRGAEFNGRRRQNARKVQPPKQEVSEQSTTREPEQPAEEEAKEADKAEEAEAGTIILHAEVVRKGVKGRPAYAKLDLASIGVTKEQFCIKK